MIDSPTIAAAEINLDEPITIVVESMTFESGLDLLLSSRGLAWAVTDEVLLVTTAERAGGETDTLAYDVRDLAGEGDADLVGEMVKLLLRPVAPAKALMSDRQTVLAMAEQRRVALMTPSILPFRGHLLVTASWTDQNHVAQILAAMRSAE